MENTGLFNAEGKALSIADVMTILPTSMINRVEVIDEKGRSYVNWNPTNRTKLQVQEKVKPNYSRRKWLNDIDSDSTGSIVCYDGKFNHDNKLHVQRFIEISDCQKKVRLHQKIDDTKEDFINKVKELVFELQLFLDHLSY